MRAAVGHHVLFGLVQQLRERGDDASIQDELALTHFRIGRITEEIDAPHKLVYSWQLEEPTEHPGESTVTVEFNDNHDATEVIITHEGFAGSPATEAHQHGWNACLSMFEQHCNS